MRTAGGPMLLGESSPFTGPNGELIVNGAFVLFYTDAAQAKRFAHRLDESAARIGGTVEPHGAVAVVWTHSPGAAVRRTVNTCALS